MRSAATAEFSNTAAVAEVSEIGREVPAGADASIQVPFWRIAARTKMLIHVRF